MWRLQLLHYDINRDPFQTFGAKLVSFMKSLSVRTYIKASIVYILPFLFLPVCLQIKQITNYAIPAGCIRARCLTL